jgi:hypothetical protein
MRSKRYRCKGSGPLKAVATLLLVLAFVTSTGGAKATPATAVASAEGAVGLAVGDLGAGYAGDCAATRSPDDLGKACSKFVAQQGNLRAYLTGRTFSEFMEWVFVEQGAAGWYPLGTLPFDDAASSTTIPWPSQ